MDSLYLNKAAKAVIFDDSEQTHPHECCGFLYGTDVDNRIITEAIPVVNTRTENRERRFEISPLEYMKAEAYADDNDLTLLGVYHSHPEHPAIASVHDLKQAMPYFSYVITSVKSAKVVDVKSWKLNDAGQFIEEKVLEQTR